MDASAELYHDVQHTKVNDAIKQIQATIGITNSTDPTSIQARLAALEDFSGSFSMGSYTDADVRSCHLTGINTSATGNVSASDTVLAAFGKLEHRTALNDAKTTFPGYGTSSSTVAVGNDSRINAGAAAATLLAAITGVVLLNTGTGVTTFHSSAFGTSSSTACVGNDSRLSDTRANPHTLTIGTGLSGTSYTGSADVTIAIDSSVVTLTGSQTLTNKTLALSSISGLGTGVATFLATPSSANLAAAVTDEAGTGALVFAGVTTLSSLVSIGTVTTGTWNATTIAINHGGTGQTTAAGAINALLPTQTSNSGKYLTTDGTNISWGTVSGGGGYGDSDVRSCALTGLSTTTGGSIVATDTVLAAFGRVAKRFIDMDTVISGFGGGGDSPYLLMQSGSGIQMNGSTIAFDGIEDGIHIYLNSGEPNDILQIDGGGGISVQGPISVGNGAVGINFPAQVDLGASIAIDSTNGVFDVLLFTAIKATFLHDLEIGGDLYADGNISAASDYGITFQGGEGYHIYGTSSGGGALNFESGLGSLMSFTDGGICVIATELSCAGGASSFHADGSCSIGSNFEVNSAGDVSFDHLVNIYGANPYSSDGPAAGAGDTPSFTISGNDTAHTIILITGGAPSSSWLIAAMSFNRGYSLVPKITWAPANAAAAALSGTSQVSVEVVDENGYTITSGLIPLTEYTEYRWTVHVIG